MVERRPGVMPPQRGGRRQGPDPRQVARRRLLALGALLVILGGLGWLAVAAIGGGDDTTQAPAPQLSTVGSNEVLRTVTRTTPTGTVETVIAVPRPYRIVFPEGFTREQMADRAAVVDKIAESKRGARLTRAAYLAATRTPRVPPCFKGKVTSMEGFLFPATYEFFPQTTSAQLVRDQLAAFCENWEKIDLTYARSTNLTPYDVLNIAAMVEKETLSPDERQLVSAVIYNRLRKRMALGIDATLRYGLDIPPTESIRQSQLESDSPYNTRVRPGLPPTPIANPGLASMQAAAHPAKVDYLYFVRKPDKKHHFFTASFEEFRNYANAHGYGGP